MIYDLEGDDLDRDVDRDDLDRDFSGVWKHCCTLPYPTFRTQ